MGKGDGLMGPSCRPLCVFLSEIKHVEPASQLFHLFTVLFFWFTLHDVCVWCVVTLRLLLFNSRQWWFTSAHPALLEVCSNITWAANTQCTRSILQRCYDQIRVVSDIYLWRLVCYHHSKTMMLLVRLRPILIWLDPNNQRNGFYRRATLVGLATAHASTQCWFISHLSSSWGEWTKSTVFIDYHLCQQKTMCCWALNLNFILCWFDSPKC